MARGRAETGHLQAALNVRLDFSPGQSPQVVTEADPLKLPKFMAIQDGFSLGYFTSFRNSVFCFSGEGLGARLLSPSKATGAGYMTEAVQGGGT
jgi:hypothetical protein